MIDTFLLVNDFNKETIIYWQEYIQLSASLAMKRSRFIQVLNKQHKAVFWCFQRRY